MHKQKNSAGPRAISESVVKTKTGRTSKQWLRLLDKWGTRKKGHPSTATYLEKKYKVSPWWAQALTIRYEYARHLRKPLAVPHILRQALARNKKAQNKFSSLPPSHQREYVEFIVEARKPETKKRRIELTINELAK
jgi:hypothetical protein